MVGNDFIDIELAKSQSNWTRARYLDKLFTKEEQEYIITATNPSIMVWALWSMKEAAYKLYTQLHPSRFYNPKSFNCKLQQPHQVIYKDFHCYVNTQITSDYVLSEARLDNCDMNSMVIEFQTQASQSHSQILHEKLIDVMSNRSHYDRTPLVLQKDSFGIPKIKYGQEEINISLSHHGRFGTYTFI